MDNFNTDKHFFVIDSFNLNRVQNRLYGFAVQDGLVVENFENYNKKDLSANGSYIYIYRESDGSILISQDYIGSYGLYLFQEGDYFALSNSFLYLVEHVKKNYRLSFNENYVNSFFLTDLCSLSATETMVNEISLLDRSAIVNIDIKTKKLSISYTDYFENTVNIDSEEGMEILDSWHNSWCQTIRNLKNSKKVTAAEITGGYDSRITFGLVKNSKINLNEIYLSSRTTEHLQKDFQIANQIAKKYSFKLNNKENDTEINYNYSLNDMIKILFYPSLGRHNLVYPYCCNSTRYIITGYGGECIRKYWTKTKKEFIKSKIIQCRRKFKNNNSLFEKSLIETLTNSFDHIEEKFNNFKRTIPDELSSAYLYREARAGNHFGSLTVEDYLCGNIRLSPLLDSNLQKLKLNNDICKDQNLLMAVIYTRYFEDLLEIPFDKENIKQDTLDFAKKINQKYPIKSFPDNKNIIISKENIVDDSNKHKQEKVSEKSFEECIKNLYYSRNVANEFANIYREKFYKTFGANINKNIRHPLQDAYTAISVSKIIKDCKYSQNNKLSDFISNNINSIDDNIKLQLIIKNKNTSQESPELISVSDNAVKIVQPRKYDDNWDDFIFDIPILKTCELVFKSNIYGKIYFEINGYLNHKYEYRLHAAQKLLTKKYYDDMFKIKYNSITINNKIIPVSQNFYSSDKKINFEYAAKKDEIIKVSLSFNQIILQE